MKTIVDSTAKTVTRKGDTWTFTQTGRPQWFAQICAEFGDEIVSAVLSEYDYYPPMIDGQERTEIKDACQAKFTARQYLAKPEIQGSLNALGYSAEEATA